MKIRLARRSWQVLVTLVVVLIAARLALPYVAKRYINSVLKDHIDGYTGHIDDLDISLYRGAYQFDHLVLQKLQKKVPISFIDCDLVDFSVAWRPLLKGHVVGRVHLDRFKLNFTPDQTGTEGEGGWRDTVHALFPLDIEELKVTRSEIHYRDFKSKPQINLTLGGLDARVTNLTNADEKKKELVSDFEITSSVLNQGKLKATGGLSILQDPPDFDVNFQATQIALPDLNEFLKAYANFDAGSGKISIFSETASTRGKIKGYVKPVITDARILKGKDSHDDHGTLPDIGVSLANFILERSSTKQVATKVPFEGSLDDPKVNTWAAVKTALGNAFGKKPVPAKIDHTITLKDAKKVKTDNDMRASSKKLWSR